MNYSKYMELKPTRILKYRDLARNVRESLESLLPGEIVEVRGEKKGVVCYLIKDLETFTSGPRDVKRETPDGWF